MRALVLYIGSIRGCRILLRVEEKWLISAIVKLDSVDGGDEMQQKSDEKSQLTQVEKFKQAARDLDCDPDESKWEDKLRKVVKQKPVPEKAQ